MEIEIGIRCLLACLRVRFDSLLFAMVNCILRNYFFCSKMSTAAR